MVALLYTRLHEEENTIIKNDYICGNLNISFVMKNILLLLPIYIFTSSLCFAQEIVGANYFKKDTLYKIKYGSTIVFQSTTEARKIFYYEDPGFPGYETAKFILINHLDEVKSLHIPLPLKPLPEDEKIFTNLSFALKEPLEVRILNLSSKKLATIPREILKFENLQELYLSDNQLDSIPSFLFDLHELRVLTLSENSISYIPSEISKLKYLQELYLHKNKIKSISLKILESPQLFLVDVSHNQITEIIDKEMKLRTYKLLDIQENWDNGSLLTQFEKDEKLTVVYYGDGALWYRYFFKKIKQKVTRTERKNNLIWNW